MQICCTKKLYDKMKITPERDAEEPALYSWHANLIDVYGAGQTVVLSNDKTRYTLVLAGLKQKHFKRLGEHIITALKETMREETVKQEVVDKYLEEAGDIVYTKTRNRSLLAKMNKSCDSTHFLGDSIDKNSIYQPEIAKAVSSIGVDRKEIRDANPNEDFYEKLQAIYGDTIFDTRAVELFVSLDLEKTQITRRLLVHPDISFFKLHLLLQAAYGWLGYHLHSFYVYPGDTPDKEFKKRYRPPEKRYIPIVELVNSEEELSYENPWTKEKRMEIGNRLSDYLPAKILYVYDYGDEWHHYIEITRTIDDAKPPIPRCIDGKGNTPPEDVGSISGYEEFIEAINDPDHPEHESYKIWAESLNYETFDIEKVNERIPRFVNSYFAYF